MLRQTNLTKIEPHVYETENFLVRCYMRYSSSIIFIFTSAGHMAPGGTSEEFKNSLVNVASDLVFVQDKRTQWYNYEETESLYRYLSKLISDYQYAAAMGESMGGSGALLFSANEERIVRVLSMSPQYSISHPYIKFDYRFESISRSIPKHFHFGFGVTKLRDQCIVLYGNLDWRDSVHASSFMADGFDTMFLDGSTHNVGAHLKTMGGKNYLIDLLDAFADFTEPFTALRVRGLLSEHLYDRALRPGFGYLDEMKRNRSIIDRIDKNSESEIGRKLGPNLCIGKRATQSSISEWSRQACRDGDAAGALTGEVSGFYNFHTNYENDPWWSVDLENEYMLLEVRLFNYLSDIAVSRRASKFVIETSRDSQQWAVVFERFDEEHFGGADGKPFIWRPEKKLETRYLRVRLTRRDWFHLDQVAIYGERVGL